MNVNNFGALIGRLTRDPKVMPNSDGSRKIMINVASRDNFQSKGADGKPQYGSQFIALEAFVSKDKQNNGVYDHMGKGDQVALQYTMRSKKYVKDGVDVYDQVLLIESVSLLDDKTTTEARRAKNQTAGGETPAPAEAAGESAIDNAPDLQDEELPFDK